MPADPEDAALPAVRPQPAVSSSLEASFLKSVFAELSGRRAPAPHSEGGVRRAAAGACAGDLRRE